MMFAAAPRADAELLFVTVIPQIAKTARVTWEEFFILEGPRFVWSVFNSSAFYVGCFPDYSGLIPVTDISFPASKTGTFPFLAGFAGLAGMVDTAYRQISLFSL